MKKKILCGLIFVSLLLTGCVAQFSGPSKETGLLDIELYDVNGNLIKKAQTMAMINMVPNVEFIKVDVGIKNIGNIDLDTQAYIHTPRAVSQAFLKEYPNCEPMKGNVECKPIEPECIIGNLIQCDKTISPEQMIVYSSGLIPSETIGVGVHILKATVHGYYEIDNRQEKITTEKVTKLVIGKDPVKPGLIVDIGTSNIQPPPPCQLMCPDGMVLKYEICVAEPYNDNGNLICKRGEFDSTRKLCVAKPERICII